MEEGIEEEESLYEEQEEEVNAHTFVPKFNHLPKLLSRQTARLFLR